MNIATKSAVLKTATVRDPEQLHENPVIEAMLTMYMDGDPLFTTSQDEALAEISRRAEKLATPGTDGYELLCELEGAAQMAGFMAGVRCACSYIHFLQKHEDYCKAG